MNLTVIGMDAGGWISLSAEAAAVVESAEVLLGGRRHLDAVPDQVTAVRVSWPSGLVAALPGLLAEHSSRKVVVLASGDPLLSGIGTTLIDLLDPAEVTVIPAISSVSLARARMGWSAESSDWVSLVGRDPHRVLRWVHPGARLLVLVAGSDGAARLAAVLTAAGFGASELVVLSHLGAEAEARVEAVAEEFGAQVPSLSVVAVTCGGGGYSLTAGLPDEAFEHDGQISKRDVRSSALARLAPRPGELLWDVGAGAGSVGIEWARTHPRCRAIAIERSPERAERVRRNAAALGVPELRVVVGTASVALPDLESPDAVFIGGGAGDAMVLAWNALKPGGRLVVHGVTLQTESLLIQWYEKFGGELTRLSVEHAAPIGSFSGWVPARAVTQWAVTR